MSEETLYCTKNDCYLAGQKLAGVDYLIVHSPAVYPTVIRARSGAGGGWYNRWNKAGVEKLVHGFIDDTGVYNFAPCREIDIPERGRKPQNKFSS